MQVFCSKRGQDYNFFSLVGKKKKKNKINGDAKSDAT